MILNGFEYDELSIEYLVSKTLNTQYSKKNEYGCMDHIIHIAHKNTLEKFLDQIA